MTNETIKGYIFTWPYYMKPNGEKLYHTTFILAHNKKEATFIFHEWYEAKKGAKPCDTPLTEYIVKYKAIKKPFRNYFNENYIKRQYQLINDLRELTEEG